MKTDQDHERKRTEFNIACEKLTCANCGQPRATGSTLCVDCLPPEGYRFRRWYIPGRMMPAIRSYVHDRIRPGRFLTAVTCNNLIDAVGMADDENMDNLPAYVSYFYNEAPAPCWGSKEKMEEWLKGGPGAD